MCFDLTIGFERSVFTRSRMGASESSIIYSEHPSTACNDHYNAIARESGRALGIRKYSTGRRVSYPKIKCNKCWFIATLEMKKENELKQRAAEIMESVNTERITHGLYEVVDYHDIDAKIPKACSSYCNGWRIETREIE